MRRLPWLLLLAFAGCGGGDPCAGHDGPCVVLTVRSSEVARIDSLYVHAFDEMRASFGGESGLPVSVALLPPAGTAAGSYDVDVQGSLAGQVVGSGGNMVNVRDGRTEATIDLSAGSACGDTTADPANCGACGHDCSALPHVSGATSCSLGRCQVPDGSCATGFAHCTGNAEDGCETDLGEPAHCGACAAACPSETPLCTESMGNRFCTAGCVAPTPDRCGGQCVDIQSSVRNCNGCGSACDYPHAGAACTMGVCQMGLCETGYADCVNGPSDGCETSISTDPNHCGSCATKCVVGQVCNSGSCADNLVSCQTTGITCRKDGCSSGKFAVSVGGEIAVDTTMTRRLWTRKTRGPASYSAAKFDCMGLSVEGISGWRLPDSFAQVPEYMTGGLNGCPVCNPAVDQAAFPDTEPANDGYWTAAYDANKAGYATVNYCDGRNNYYSAPDQPHVYRCTHDPL